MQRRLGISHRAPTTRALFLFTLVLVAACNRQDQAPAPNAVAEAPMPPVANAPVPSLEGAWKVTSVGNDRGTGLILTLGKGKATLSAGCLRRGFTYKQHRNQVAFASAPAGSRSCGSAPSAGQEAAFAALPDANLAVFGTDGRDVTLTGYGGSLTLERR